MPFPLGGSGLGCGRPLDVIMRKSAFLLGVVGGLAGLMVGFFLAGLAELTGHDADPDAAGFSAVPYLLSFKSVYLAPALAISGGVLSLRYAGWGAALMAIASGLMFATYGYTAFSMAPVVFVSAGAVIAVLGARTPVVIDDD